MLFRYLMIALLALSFVAQIGSISAAETAAPDVSTEWTGLVKDMASYKEKLESLQLKFSKATAAEKGKIRLEAVTLNNTFQKQILARMTELAPQAFKLNPDDSVAAELMLQSLLAKNQYSELVKVAESVLKKNPKAQLALNYCGVGMFATHDFEGAVKVLKTAEAEGLLMSDQGGRYLDEAEQYIEFWKTEQAIRAKEDAATGDEQLPIVNFSTTKGDIEILMLENEAPNTVANFISLVEKKYYDGLKFHRVLPGFMAQGGCPNSRENVSAVGSGGPGYVIPCECYGENVRRHFAGSLSMAHAGRNTGGSQFFLTHLPTSHLNPEPGKTEGVHTVFGRTIKGLDVILALEKDDEIKSAVVVRKRNHKYVPKTQPNGK